MALIIPPVTITHDTYGGATLRDVYGAMPDEPGLCEWFPNFRYDAVNARGYPERLTVTVTISIRMPRWTDRDQARPAERTEWDRFYQALLEHERGHEARARAAAQAMHTRMAKSLAADLQTVMDEENDKIKLASAAYDTATDHGRQPPPGTTITFPP
jgi:predicted secreted Zn-dependent protease